MSQAKYALEVQGLAVLKPQCNGASPGPESQK